MASRPPSTDPYLDAQSVLPNAGASDLCEISGLRQQILGNANVMFPTKTHLQVCVVSGEWPNRTHYGARLLDISTREVLMGREFAPSVPEALRQLLQATCDALRDSCTLHLFTSPYPSLTG